MSGPGRAFFSYGFAPSSELRVNADRGRSTRVQPVGARRHSWFSAGYKEGHAPAGGVKGAGADGRLFQRKFLEQLCKTAFE